MNLDPSIKKTRVFSAKITPDNNSKGRPMSGQVSQTYSRKQLIQNVYTAQMTLPSRVNSARVNNGNIKISLLDSQKISKRPSVKINKSKQEMTQEISSLKQTINKLVQQLSHHKGKIETIKKKNNKYSKILTLQFQDQKQWNSNACNNHLVTGIKTMYDNLKQKFELKCQQYDRLIKYPSNTNRMQSNTYIKSLEKQINSLKQVVLNLSQGKNEMVVQSQAQRQASIHNYAELSYQNEIIKQKYKQLLGKYKMGQQNQKDLNKKIQLLQKLIIEKDNNIHAIQKKNKNLSSQNLTLKEELNQIKLQFSMLTVKDNQKTIQYRQSLSELQTKYSQERKNIEKEKNEKIKLLKKDNDYYQDIIKELRSSNTLLSNQLQQIRQKNIRNSKNNNNQTNFQNKVQRKQSYNDEKVEKHRKNQSSGPRQPQRADIKHSQNSLKKRKIQLNELLQLSELIKYRLIIKSQPIQKVKSLFSGSSSQDQWSKTYINYRETKDILQNEPFCLEEDQAILLARYLIEDVEAEFVYCDDQNENHRQVVKSIIKTLIQDYEIFNEYDEVWEEYKFLKENYKENLSKTLITCEPSGKISKNKLFQVMKSIGIQTSDNLKSMLIGKLAAKSVGLNLLEYKWIF